MIIITHFDNYIWLAAIDYFDKIRSRDLESDFVQLIKLPLRRFALEKDCHLFLYLVCYIVYELRFSCVICIKLWT